MIDIKFLRENPEAVKENIRKKFQESKLELVDEVIALDEEVRKTQQEADDIRASRNKISKEIGALMSQGKKEEAEEKKAEVAANARRLAELESGSFCECCTSCPVRRKRKRTAGKNQERYDDNSEYHRPVCSYR